MENFAIGRVDPRLFGAFVEHLGRGVYGGLYEPGHPTADERGFRHDVLDLVKELGHDHISTPGGNFVSTYRWEDGVGPVDQRPKAAKLCLGLDRTENTFGVNEFRRLVPSRERRAYARRQPRHARATRTPPISSSTATSPGGTTLSELRRSHGWTTARRQVLVPRQRDGRRLADSRRRGIWPARASGRQDDALGRQFYSTRRVRVVRARRTTYGHWDATVLEHAFDQVEWISLHTYLNNWKDDTPALLASADLIDAFIEGVIAVADAAAAKRRSSKRIMLSLDEWNVWYRTRRPFEYRVRRGWPVAPPILEEIYSLEDALAVGGVLISFLNHADRVRCACLAQLVNVIAPITTEIGGPAWRQTIFYPFAQMSRLARGEVLRAKVECESYAAAYYDPYTVADALFPVPQAAYLKLSAVAQEDGGLALFALNRDLDQEMTALVDLRGFDRLILAEATVLTDSDLKAANTKAAPTRVKPGRLGGVVVGAETVRVELPPASWSVVNLRASP